MATQSVTAPQDGDRMRIHKGRVMHRVRVRAGGDIESQCRTKHPVKGVSGTIPRAFGTAGNWSPVRYWYPDCKHCPDPPTHSKEGTTGV